MEWFEDTAAGGSEGGDLISVAEPLSSINDSQMSEGIL